MNEPESTAGGFRPVQVISHAGYRAAEQPTQVDQDGTWLQVEHILNRWRDPDHEYFGVLLSNGQQALLRHTLDAEDWEISGAP